MNLKAKLEAIQKFTYKQKKTAFFDLAKVPEVEKVKTGFIGSLLEHIADVVR